MALSLKFDKLTDKRNEVAKEYEQNKDKLALARQAKKQEREKREKEKKKVRVRSGEELVGKIKEDKPEYIILEMDKGTFKIDRKVILEISELGTSTNVAPALTTAPPSPSIISPLPFDSIANNVEGRDRETVSGKFDKGRFWVGWGVLSGNVTYRIGGHFSSPVGSADFWFPISELEWPLIVKVVMIGGEIYWAKNWEIGGELSKNLQTDAGKIKDSDWTDGDNPRLKTVYSESDTNFDAYTTDFALRYWLTQKMFSANSAAGLAIGGGWLYEHFYWAASNTDQWYPQNPEMGHDLISGLVGTYKATVSMPYFEVTGKIETQQGNSSLLLRLGYSPFTSVEDADDHIIRQISATSSLSGSAYKLALQGRYSFSSSWFIMAKWDMLSFDIKGRDNNIVYGGPDQGLTWSIEHETFSTQNLLSLAVGLRF